VASILSGDFSRAIPIVSSLFTVKHFQLHPKEDYVQILIAESEVKDKFPLLLKELGKIGMLATAKRSEYFRWLMPTLRSVRESMGDGVVLGVYKMPSHKPRSPYKKYIPLALFLLTITVVFLDAPFRSFEETQQQDPFLLAAIYTISLLGILGIHELGHILANRKYGIRASWPYFIPGIPSILPTFGALIVLRAHMPNRNVVFDVGIAGPIAGLIVTVIVSMYGSSISTLISIEEAEKLFDANRLGPLPYGESILMIATLHLTGMVVEGTVLVASPVLFAAWLGFIITFLNLMPAWQLDGGHIARSALGVRPHKILTYVSIAILLILQFYPMALLVLIFSIRAPESSPLDDVTPLSRKRKALFFVALGMAVICAPIPNSFTPFGAGL
jgi:membrane-associated protease RseP (regulator of RpoE activity)